MHVKVLSCGTSWDWLKLCENVTYTVAVCLFGFRVLSFFYTHKLFCTHFFFGFNGRCCNLKRNHPRNTWITFRGSDDTTLTVGIKWSFSDLWIFFQTDWMRHWPQQRLSKVTRLLTADVCLHYLNVLFFALHCLLSNFYFCVCGIVIALKHMISLSNGIHSTFVSIGWVMNLILKLRIPGRITLEPADWKTAWEELNNIQRNAHHSSLRSLFCLRCLRSWSSHWREDFRHLAGIEFKTLPACVKINRNNFYFFWFPMHFFFLFISCQLSVQFKQTK